MDGPALVKLVKNNKKQSQIKLPQILVGSFLPMDLHYHSDNASLGRLPPSFSLSSTLCIQGLFIPTASDVVSGIGPSKPCLVVKITPTLLPVVASTCAVHIKVKRTGLVICSSRQLNFWLMSDFKMGFARCSLAHEWAPCIFQAEPFSCGCCSVGRLPASTTSSCQSDLLPPRRVINKKISH